MRCIHLITQILSLFHQSSLNQHHTDQVQSAVNLQIEKEVPICHKEHIVGPHLHIILHQEN